ncbi:MULTISPECIES: tRNA pseudouridine(38-40) synthase TruA [unclassified Actinobaculum]|uniref:tRNA pseudouridine(38-40) synthase TruA n=1 Tax=unclassified Actinobaculum TaxID=2609299 RepID=UPI000D52A2FF|nr:MULTISPECIES: tRNA pseudouridine(38-40) synthase TruA [unclassified Actinobaculum]AWE42024.1 tRNA pseudouridine(38-40) synthase TruA [Actinobaculum sp. 313]RTE50057.1 tRNA pseudouridine(38-40) synthase TruA [Actinobaculum sp. 352]
MTSTVSQTVRLRLDLAYDGAGFHGWAAQPGLRTVEGTLAEALTTVLRHEVQLTVAGRTDAGVHARGQVAHVDVPAAAFAGLSGRSKREPTEALRARLTGVLLRASVGGPRGSSDLLVRAVSLAPAGFDARFSALARTYSYQVADSVGGYDPLRRSTVLWLPERLDVQAMQRAAIPLLGEHDFLSYCKPREGATTVRELQLLEIARRGELVQFTVRADAFCHSMVRTLVGTLLRVGNGKRPEEWPAERLAARRRDGEVVVAPAHPLTLERVNYPDDAQLASRAQVTRAVRNCGC